MQEMQETWVQSLGWEGPLEEERTPHSSTLAWKIPWTEEPGRQQSMGYQNVGHDWAPTYTCMFPMTELQCAHFLIPPSVLKCYILLCPLGLWSIKCLLFFTTFLFYCLHSLWIKSITHFPLGKMFPPFYDFLLPYSHVFPSLTVKDLDFSNPLSTFFSSSISLHFSLNSSLIKGIIIQSLNQIESKSFATPWTVAHQAPLSVGFPREEYWSGLPFPSPGIFPTQGSNWISWVGRQFLYHWATREAPSKELFSLKLSVTTWIQNTRDTFNLFSPFTSPGYLYHWTIM